MDRAQRLAILNAASDENLDLALQAIGIQSSGDDFYGEGSDMGVENNVPTWDSLDVSVPAGTKKPLVDKSKLFIPQQQPMATNAYGMQEPGDQEEMMSSTGMV